jgi:Cyclophilin type peptidyl-prolyl cis-trans isomerase/CLD
MLSIKFFIDFCFILFHFSLHTVFGRVVSGMEVVRQIESLPVDRNSRPFDEAKVISCGELVKQVKGMSYRYLILENYSDITWFFLFVSFSQKRQEKEKNINQGRFIIRFE